MQNRPLSGKSEKDLPVPQFFSWVNNGNEGCTEEHAEINLDFFRWLRDEYGMQLEIYALDAGNFDSPLNHYFDPDNKQYKINWPEGFKNIAERTKKAGMSLGIWCGPDGFGNTEEEERRRFEQVVSLCRDYNVALLKFDLVCGELRTEKQSIFEKMIAECRKYRPDLIVLNHRLELGEAQKYATTFLWGGQETHVDVLINNSKTAPHNRQGAFDRELVPGLRRLTEDHGVCLSSCIDFFEDDLVLQAFNRALILSPEIYGSPMFLRDDEFARLARLYNLSKKYAPLLVNGIELPEKYGEFAVSRGDGNGRLITLRNNSWQSLCVDVKLDTEIGLDCNRDVYALQYHPTQRYYGKRKYGSVLRVTVEPFRACLLYVGAEKPDDILLADCDYEVVADIENKPARVNIVRAGVTEVLNGEYVRGELNGKPVALDNITVNADEYLYAPRLLTRLKPAEVPANAEKLVETTLFSVDGNSLDGQCRKRAGESRYPEVQRARDAFFSQRSYMLRGCEPSAMFDGKPDTFYDSYSVVMNRRIEGGCLRLDFGKTEDIDTLTVEFFISAPEMNIKPENLKNGDTSVDLSDWSVMSLQRVEDGEECSIGGVLQSVDRESPEAGHRVTATYKITAPCRYIRLPDAPCRIFGIKFYKRGSQVNLVPSANIFMPYYGRVKTRAARKATVTLPSYKKGSYLAFACNGTHGVEGVYCAAECNGKILPCPTRAPSYPCPWFIHFVVSCICNYTYFMPLPDGLEGSEIDLYALIGSNGDEYFETDVYLCNPNDEKHGAELILYK